MTENPDAEPPHKPRVSLVYAHGPILAVLCPQHVPCRARCGLDAGRAAGLLNAAPVRAVLPAGETHSCCSEY